MRTRSIFHADLDAFFVSVERVLDPRLCGRPVVVGGPADGRGVVAAASYEARAFGVCSAMPMAQAMRRCPGLLRVSGSHSMYGRASRAVFDVLGQYTPILEKVSIDEAYLDLTGTGLLFGGAIDVADRMRREVRERLRLDLTIGVSQNRLVSKVASAFAKPYGLFDVALGQEATFLAPLDVRALPGIGPVTAHRLKDWNIEKLGALADTASWFLRETFGDHGPALQSRARGEDDTPVCPPWERNESKSIGHEETFATDVDDHAFLRAKLSALLSKAARRLRKKGLLARKVSVKLRYADFVTETRDCTLREPSDLDGDFLDPMQELLHHMASRRTLVRLLGVRLTGLVRGFRQTSLFDAEQDFKTESRSAIVSAMDDIRDKYGASVVQSGEAAWLSNSR
ncbi:MAG: DNA polymerase IV [Planctomycetes bacterium]|jgi:DNA polymerase IV|nr:DNA polymerase IV [Planctomycetota bacterium]MBT4028402.1 DNA polymerase IV [Planctomycetota bacterium]MBT4559727.1 DNA polymerase IV [Planctomycetota bacterium]MBT5102238.1 DNA polymerase IV [Planctomycetota bacterium]MBT7012634.1 DNA polymerase IV [Planctomycetota bacterium]